MGDTYAYGLWGAVIFNVLVFLLFALSFLRPQRKREWHSLGLFSAFIVALFTEMYGFPLTIYLLTSILGSRYPVIDPFTHINGHLWVALLGGSTFVWALVMLLSGAAILSGLIIMGAGWRQIHKAKGELVTDGIYSRVRHPQYLGLLLIVVGMLLQWPTIVTMLMAPILIAAYVWLAGREEKELEERLGDRYKSYKERTPVFLPALVRGSPSTERGNL